MTFKYYSTDNGFIVLASKFSKVYIPNIEGEGTYDVGIISLDEALKLKMPHFCGRVEGTHIAVLADEYGDIDDPNDILFYLNGTFGILSVNGNIYFCIYAKN